MKGGENRYKRQRSFFFVIICLFEQHFYDLWNEIVEKTAKESEKICNENSNTTKALAKMNEKGTEIHEKV